MFGWFRAKCECPVDATKRAWLDDRWRWLENQFGIERLRKIQVILPRAEFFPDPFYVHGTAKHEARNTGQLVAHVTPM